jgi:hypothetical protein
VSSDQQILRWLVIHRRHKKLKETSCGDAASLCTMPSGYRTPVGVATDVLSPVMIEFITPS